MKKFKNPKVFCMAPVSLINLVVQYLFNYLNISELGHGVRRVSRHIRLDSTYVFDVLSYMHKHERERQLNVVKSGRLMFRRLQ
ncbi:unnamed protein product [Trichogramma brassicae]|uniref:Uncharacterized protein n=1 Tax=Trichogramma brassicae TaxID=86971 RepID=A0A6H5I8N8_9HYME|nr:unnamed protein product [Trichogramma brassicae]